MDCYYSQLETGGVWLNVVNSQLIKAFRTEISWLSKFLSRLHIIFPSVLKFISRLALNININDKKQCSL